MKSQMILQSTLNILKSRFKTKTLVYRESSVYQNFFILNRSFIYMYGKVQYKACHMTYDLLYIRKVSYANVTQNCLKIILHNVTLFDL